MRTLDCCADHFHFVAQNHCNNGRAILQAIRRIPRNPMVRTADPSVPVSVSGSRGGSPLQADALRPVSDGHCVLTTGGGKQPEENDHSVTQVNSIRPGCLASLLGNGEAQTCFGKPATLRDHPAGGARVSKRWREQSGGWRRNGPKARYIKQGDLSDDQDPTGEQEAVRDAGCHWRRVPLATCCQWLRGIGLRTVFPVCVWIVKTLAASCQWHPGASAVCVAGNSGGVKLVGQLRFQ